MIGREGTADFSERCICVARVTLVLNLFSWSDLGGHLGGGAGTGVGSKLNSLRHCCQLTELPACPLSCYISSSGVRGSSDP